MTPVRISRKFLASALALVAAGWVAPAWAGQPENMASAPVLAAKPITTGWNPHLLHGSDAANAVLMRAISLVGTPYVWGGATPNGGFDCSGLVNYVFHDMLDVQLPRTSRELSEAQGPRIDFESLRPGDLVFFGAGGLVSHVGIYIGEGRFIHAPRTGTTVRLEKIDTDYWQGHYSGARRLIEP